MSAAPMRRSAWIGVALLALVGIGLYWHFDLGRLLTLESLKSGRDSLLAWYGASPGRFIASYFALYLAVAALSLPGAAVLTLAGGAILGFGVGLVVVSFASSIGALLAFLAARHLLRDAVQARFGKRLASINEGMRRDGALYLLSLRLVPAFPFFLVNLLVALTPIGAVRFYVISQLGMLAGTAVYVNAGTQLGSIDTLADVLSPGLIASFALLAVFPLVAKGIVGALRRREVFARWEKPKRFDRNLIVIGAGAGGLVTAYIAAAVRAKVTLVEAHRMGGDCLNHGCVPSKTLIRSALLARQLRDAARLGITGASGTVDFAAVMARVQRVIRTLEPNDSVERYTALGVDVRLGRARITSPWSVQITGADGVQTLTTRSIVIASGARPFVPPIPGLAEAGFLTSDTVWGLTALPRRLLVLGGGPIGCELAQAFARLGAQVTLVETAPRLMGREDAEISALIAAALAADGVRVLTRHTALRCEREAGVQRLVVRHGAGDRSGDSSCDSSAECAIEFDALLYATGRTPRVEGFGLEELGIPLTARGTIQTDGYQRTRVPNIFAVGDVAGPHAFTHTASHQAWYAAINALFGRFWRFKVDTSAIPWATFTDPEVARVGLSEAEANAQGVAFEVTRFELADLDRAITDDTAHGFIKVLTVPGRDTILGVAIVGAHAGELLAEYVLAMKHGLGLKRILGTIHIYPTLAEANKAVAGVWRRAHAPQRLLGWAERLHAWHRA